MPYVSITTKYLVNFIIKINSPLYLVILLSEECEDLERFEKKATKICNGQELDTTYVG